MAGASRVHFQQVETGGYTRYDVADVQAAVDLAVCFQRDGKYRWFRGQNRDWPPHTSRLRLVVKGDPEALQRQDRRAEMFLQWLSQRPDLKHLLASKHLSAAEAVMQHYGIATSYLDFTTDPGVAGYFAASGAPSGQQEPGCIYCLDPADLIRFSETVLAIPERQGQVVEPMEIDVANLWRLQAQSGVFLLVTYNWEVDYPMDRICFLQRGPAAAPTQEQVYPEHRSALEQKLDEYFDLERTVHANEMMREMIRRLQAQGGNAGYTVLNEFERGIHAPAFVDAEALHALPSWEREALAPWRVDALEAFQDAVGRVVKLDLAGRDSAAELARAVEFGVRQLLRGRPGLRSEAVEWVLENCPSTVDAGHLSSMLQRAWNGIRHLPYDDDDCGGCLGRIALLFGLEFQAVLDRTRRRKVLAAAVGDSKLVEFGNAAGNGSKGWVSTANLRRALRANMRDLLVAEHRARVDDFDDLFGVVHNPTLMFDFGAFKSLFASDLIPTQIIDGRQLVLFNPAELTSFGNP